MLKRVIESQKPSLTPTAMGSRSHLHTYIFNDDGFEVCSLCGVCTSQREMKAEFARENIKKNDSSFSHILENVKIGYIEEIEEAYKKLKTVLKRGYPNIVLYAYCTYNVLMENFVFYSFFQISNIFKIPNFSKYYCQIENKNKSENHNFCIEDKKYIYTALIIFLSQNDKRNLISKGLSIFEKVSRLNHGLKQNILIAVVIFFTISPPSCSTANQLKTDLCENYSINFRTLTRTIKNVKKCLNHQNLLTI